MTGVNYEERAKELGLATKEEIMALVNSSSSSSPSQEVVFLDVRGQDEIAEEPLKGPFRVISSPCTRTDATELVQMSLEIMPQKNAAIIIFCKSGARAKTAKDALERLDYTRIYNAGGVKDLDYLLLEEES